MSAGLVQAPDSKRYHVAFDGYSPVCNDELGSFYLPESEAHEGWRAPHGICSNCAREVESAVRLIAAEVRADALASLAAEESR